MEKRQVQVANNIMSADKEAIEWLRRTAEDENHPLHFAWNVLRKYYDRCIDELQKSKSLKFDEKGTGSKENIYREVVKLLDNNEEFKKEVCEFFKLNEDELMNKITTREDNQEKYDMYIKIFRLYNMRLKLGHSARITYLANEQLKSMLEGCNEKEYTLLRNTVLLSALLHDIGRFYQAVRFNTLYDEKMNLEKDEVFKNLRVDHAVAGYYYSIAEALQLHINSDNDYSKEEIEKYIEEVVAALVVRYHQEPNSKKEEFDYDGDVKNLNDSNNGFINKLYGFITYSSDISKNIIGAPVLFDKGHKDFTDKFIEDIFQRKNIDKSIIAGFQADPDIEELENNIKTEIANLIKKAKLESLEKLSEQIIEIINNNLKKYQEKKNISSIELTETEKELYKKMIVDNLKDMLNYDIATTISKIIKENPEQVDDLIKIFISKCYSTTTDADKIDIFNQRALGIYNSANTMNTYEVFPKEDMSLKEILETYFKFKINDNPLVIDNKLLNILNRLDKDILKRLQETVFNNIDIFYENDQGKTQFINNIELNEETTKRFKLLLDSNYLDLLSELYIIPKDRENFKEFKTDYFQKLLIQIPSRMLKENIKDMSEEEQKKFLKNLVLTPGMFERFKKDDIKGMQKGWECTTDDAIHVSSSSVAGLLIQINQFIFVNMRNLGSFEYLKDNKILERILDNYDKDSPEHYMLEEYIEYAIDFINKVINYCKSNNKISISKKELEELRNNSNKLELNSMFRDDEEKYTNNNHFLRDNKLYY